MSGGLGSNRTSGIADPSLLLVSVWSPGLHSLVRDPEPVVVAIVRDGVLVPEASIILALSNPQILIVVLGVELMASSS